MHSGRALNGATRHTLEKGSAMRFGMMIPNFARWFRDDAIWQTCLKGKEIGLDAFSFVDHVIVTRNQYAGFGNGYMDIYTAMAYIAAITNAQGWKPILTQSVVDIPYRPAIQQAKIAATVDSLSGGRLMIGAGAGYVEEEFRALGIDITKRGSMTHEYLATMKELWTNQVASFHGKYTNFDDMTISVRPVTQPHPPILYGSHGPVPRKHIAESYQGVIGSTGTVSAFQEDMKDLDRLWKENGRSGRPFLMAGLRAHLTTDRAEAGETVTKGVVPPGQSAPAERVERVTEGERVYQSTYKLNHVDDVVEELKKREDMGVDLAILWLPSYAFKGMTNLQLQLQQMEMLAEHVLSKFSKDTRPIEMDFGGKLYRPFESA